ncbi:MAG: ABC transporter permease, partial [Mangrovimonas sp.]|nr:ABC transporter permease [Mangrovimonas sp.]
GKIAFTFSLLAILIACLGLFGLASYMAEQRTKELGVRKVLGASAGNLVKLLSKDFVKLVGVAFLIAVPLSWYAMHSWLEDFAYRTSLSWWIFIVAGLLAMIIAVATISFQAIKAALTNPVKSLRTE